MSWRLTQGDSPPHTLTYMELALDEAVKKKERSKKNSCSEWSHLPQTKLLIITAIKKKMGQLNFAAERKHKSQILF